MPPSLRRHLPAMLAVALLLGGLERLAAPDGEPPWTPAERALIESLGLGALPPLPPAPDNAVADVPLAAAMGQRLFFDPRTSGNGAVSCATCHQPARRFTDGLATARAIGTSPRNTPSLVGVAYSPWLYWDGRKDSLWSQALAPLENPDEHGTTRVAVAQLVHADPAYRRTYQTLFGPLPALDDTSRFPPAASPNGSAEGRRAWQAMTAEDRDRVNAVFANVGKTLAAFERRLLPQPARFDRYVAALENGDEATAETLLSPSERRGLRLFIGRAQCVQCHNGPLFTNHEFHNTGVISAEGEEPDRGRAAGLRELRADPFNCLGRYSDDPERACAELEFARGGPELLGAMRTPSLRNLQSTEPFMHKGQLATLRDVLEHYNRAPPALIGHNEAKPLGLTPRDLDDLEAFLGTLATPPPGVADSDASEAQVLDLDVLVDPVL
ncbi:MAG TPA: cytochrome c peroxidase [Pseudomonadales bacterium]